MIFNPVAAPSVSASVATTPTAITNSNKAGVANNVVPMVGLRSQWNQFPNQQRLCEEHGIILQSELENVKIQHMGPASVHTGKHPLLGHCTIIICEEQCTIVSRHISIGTLKYQYHADLVEEASEQTA